MPRRLPRLAAGASATLSSGNVSGATVIVVSDVNGAAGAAATANGILGNYAVTASVGSVSVSFYLTNSTNVALGSITATGGTPQSALVGSAFSSPLQVTVKDVSGNAGGWRYRDL